MKQHGKRILSVLLIAVLFVSGSKAYDLKACAVSSNGDRIVAAAKQIAEVNPHAYDGYCLQFCVRCYFNAGYPDTGSYETAYEAGSKWIQSDSKSNIPVGAMVFYDRTWSSYGHVGIYAGNGYMYDAESAYGGVQLRTFKTNGYRGWGWYCGIAPDKVTDVNVTVSDAQYLIVNKASGMALTVPASNGSPDPSWLKTEKNTASAAQLFQISPVSGSNINKQYYIRNQSVSGYQYVNAYSKDNKINGNGTHVHLYEYNSVSSKLWNFRKEGSYFIIYNVMNPNMVLTADNANSSQVFVRQYSENNDLQRWSLQVRTNDTKPTEPTKPAEPPKPADNPSKGGFKSWLVNTLYRFLKSIFR